MLPDVIPPGLCQCGCGAKTRLVPRTSSKKGLRKGTPYRFILGHANRRPAEARFWDKVKKTPTCWEWIGAGGRGTYGSFLWNGKQGMAHRYAYELLVGPIPSGLYIDHLCRNRSCVNPAHLEPVTPLENNLRGLNATKTHCARGHEYTPENTYVVPRCQSRQCRECKRMASARWYHRSIA